MTLYTVILTRKIDLHIFSLISILRKTYLQQIKYSRRNFSIEISYWILEEGNRWTGLVKAFQNSNTNKLLFLGRNLVKIIFCCPSFTSINFLGKKCWPEIQVCKFVTVIGAIISRLLKFTHCTYTYWARFEIMYKWIDYWIWNLNFELKVNCRMTFALDSFANFWTSY